MCRQQRSTSGAAQSLRADPTSARSRTAKPFWFLSAKLPRRLEAKSVDAAATEILRQVLKWRTIAILMSSTSLQFSSGASAALKAAAHRLKSPGSKFDRVFHLDCSLWKSRRALVAEELELPQSVMVILTWHHKENDFNGVEGAGKELREIYRHFYRRLANVNRLALVFHNGTGSYIDLNEFGIPLNPNLEDNMLLWTVQGRFRSSVTPDSHSTNELNPGGLACCFCLQPLCCYAYSHLSYRLPH